MAREQGQIEAEPSWLDVLEADELGRRRAGRADRGCGERRGQWRDFGVWAKMSKETTWKSLLAMPVLNLRIHMYESNRERVCTERSDKVRRG